MNSYEADPKVSMPVSFRLALVGFVIALIGVGVIIWVIRAVTGWAQISYGLYGMMIVAAGLVSALFSAGVCAARHPAWRKPAIVLLAVALAGAGLLVLFWANA